MVNNRKILHGKLLEYINLYRSQTFTERDIYFNSPPQRGGLHWLHAQPPVLSNQKRRKTQGGTMTSCWIVQSALAPDTTRRPEAEWLQEILAIDQLNAQIIVVY